MSNSLILNAFKKENRACKLFSNALPLPLGGMGSCRPFTPSPAVWTSMPSWMRTWRTTWAPLRNTTPSCRPRLMRKPGLQGEIAKFPQIYVDNQYPISLYIELRCTLGYPADKSMYWRTCNCALVDCLFQVK